tara:strand:- start:3725 stop:3928 length:204 start_codon:yes stop_codon:yes gene_type:complete
MNKQKRIDARAKEILEKHRSGDLTTEEAAEEYEKIKRLVGTNLNSEIEEYLRESHREEILRDLPQTD